jgi:hypothetical protein
MADEDRRADRHRGVVQEGYTLVARRPRNVAPGNIVSLETAERVEKRGSLFDDIFAEDPIIRTRARRLDRMTDDPHDREPYLDYEG